MTAIIMIASKVLAGYLLLLFNLAMMFLLKNKLSNKGGELVFIFLALIFAFIILKGLNDDSVWTWPAMIVFIAICLANSVYLFMATKHATYFVATVIANLVGMVLSIVWHIEEDEDD